MKDDDPESPAPSVGAETERVALAIQAYLALNPAAADSEQGVAQWWLPAMGSSATLAQVHDALEALQQRGVVSAQRLPDGRLIYLARPACGPP